MLDACGDLVHHLLLDSIVVRGLGHGGWRLATGDVIEVRVCVALSSATGGRRGSRAWSWRRESWQEAQHAVDELFLSREEIQSLVGHNRGDLQGRTRAMATKLAP